jgi:hypothetical protein
MHNAAADELPSETLSLLFITEQPSFFDYAAHEVAQELVSGFIVTTNGLNSIVGLSHSLPSTRKCFSPPKFSIIAWQGPLAWFSWLVPSALCLLVCYLLIIRFGGGYINDKGFADRRR